MTSVAADWNHHLLVLIVVGKNALETVCQVEEAVLGGNFTLEELRLNYSLGDSSSGYGGVFVIYT